MKQCPECGHTYKDDLNFCLQDGSVLRAAHDDEETVVSPSPVVPTSARPQQRAPWIVLGVVGLILLVLIFGGIGFALWAANRDDRTNAQATNSPTPSLNISASPNSSPTPLCVALGNCPTPTPTPSPQSSPTPAPTTPTPSPTVPPENSIKTGTYQCELNYPINEDGVQTHRVLKLQFTFNAGGSYTAQGYASIPATGMADRLYLETQGSYMQWPATASSPATLAFYDRLERQMDFETNSWKPWTVPRGGSKARNKIQNVTPNSFQLDMGPNGS